MEKGKIVTRSDGRAHNGWDKVLVFQALLVRVRWTPKIGTKFCFQQMFWSESDRPRGLGRSFGGSSKCSGPNQTDPEDWDEGLVVPAFQVRMTGKSCRRDDHIFHGQNLAKTRMISPKT